MIQQLKERDLTHVNLGHLDQLIDVLQTRASNASFELRLWMMPRQDTDCGFFACIAGWAAQTEAWRDGGNDPDNHSGWVFVPKYNGCVGTNALAAFLGVDVQTAESLSSPDEGDRLPLWGTKEPTRGNALGVLYQIRAEAVRQQDSGETGSDKKAGSISQF